MAESAVSGQRLAGRVVVLTGAAGGIGIAYARRLASEGADLVLSDVSAPAAELAALLSQNARARFVQADVRSMPDADRLVDAARSHFGRLDVLINNAALFTTLQRRPFDELTVQDWETTLGVNVIGAFVCTRAAVAAMKPQKRGKIINIASNVVHKGLPNLLHYVASKGAVMAMTRSLARELGPFGITVNAVAPGYVMHDATARTDGGRNEQVVRLRSLGRTQTPDDLVGTIAFLASADSDFISGQTIIVDGGEVFA